MSKGRNICNVADFGSTVNLCLVKKLHSTTSLDILAAWGNKTKWHWRKNWKGTNWTMSRCLPNILWERFNIDIVFCVLKASSKGTIDISWSSQSETMTSSSEICIETCKKKKVHKLLSMTTQVLISKMYRNQYKRWKKAYNS